MSNAPLSPDQIEQQLDAFRQPLTFVKGLDLSKPIDLAQYVENIQHNGHARNDVVKRFSSKLKNTSEGGVYLFSGQVGSGKSTELLRLKTLIESPKCKVFYIDLEDWINLYEPITLSTLIISMMAAWIVEAGSQMRAQRSVAQRIADFFTETEIIPKELTLNATVASLKLGFQNDPNFRQKLDEAVKTNRKGFVEQTQAFALKHKLEVCSTGQDCVLIVDSLEKIRGYGDTVKTVYTSLEEIFIGNSAALHIPGIKIIYSIAPSLEEQNSQLGAIYGQSNVVKLPSLHVLKRDGSADDEGIAIMLTMLGKRYADWRKVLTQAQVERVAVASGGDLRDFLRILRAVTFYEVTQLPIDDASVDDAITRMSPAKQVPDYVIDWLAKVHETKEACLSSTITAPILQHYLSSKHLLMYANGEVWYDVHPLLKDWVKKRRTPAASVAASPALNSPSVATA